MHTLLGVMGVKEKFFSCQKLKVRKTVFLRIQPLILFPKYQL